MALIRFTSSHCRAFLWFRGKVLHNPPDMASCHSKHLRCNTAPTLRQTGCDAV